MLLLLGRHRPIGKTLQWHRRILSLVLRRYVIALYIFIFIAYLFCVWYYEHMYLISLYPKSDPTSIFTHSQAYLKDDFPNKVNVGVGAYRDDNGKPFVLPVVRDAEKEINLANVDHEYSGIVSFVGKHTSLICVLAASPLIFHLVDTSSTTISTTNRRAVQAL